MSWFKDPRSLLSLSLYVCVYSGNRPKKEGGEREQRNASFCVLVVVAETLELLP